MTIFYVYACLHFYNEVHTELVYAKTNYLKKEFIIPDPLFQYIGPVRVTMVTQFFHGS